MKTLKLLALAAFALLFSQCKTTAPTAPSGPAPSVLEVHQLLDSTQAIFLNYADLTGGDVRESMIRTVSWLNSEPNVQLAATSDSLYIDITLKSGLTTSFYFEEVDDSGFDVFRGGGSDVEGSIASALTGTHSANTITNKKVLIFAADTKSLSQVTPTIARTFTRLTNAGLGLDVTILKDEQCSYGVVEHFGDYGLVIIDTHGQKDGFLVGSKLDLSVAPTSEADLKAKISTQAGTGTYDKISAGGLKLAKSVKANPKKPNWQKSVIPQEDRTLWFTSKYLNLLPSMPNTVIVGNMCYSGWSVPSWTFSWPATTITSSTGVVTTRPGGTGTGTTDPIKTAFMNRQLISYYCYAFANGQSTGVQDVFAAAREDALIARLVGDLDSTRVIHLQPDNITEYFDTYQYFDPRSQTNITIPNLYFKHFGADNYSYDPGCVTQFTDARDGQVYKAVCIGKQNWMAQNLNYDVPGSLYSDSSQANRNTYGRFYFWNDMMAGSGASNANPSGVQGICPKGWHIPSAAEWDQLVAFVGGASVAGKALKSTSPLWLYADVSGKTHPGGGSNSSGFNALPGGWINTDFSNPGGFIGGQFNFNATFHTASELHPIVIDGIQMNGGQDGTQWFTFYTDQHLQDSKQVTALPCRCVKD